MKTSNYVKDIKTWLNEASTIIHQTLNEDLTISQKSGRTDLVTNMDEEIQTFFIDKILKNYPNDQILAEEKNYNQLDSFEGTVWIIDPIDGTLNFILEKENFCIMIALFKEGVGQLGFIYDVMSEELFWGGKGLGVFCNNYPITFQRDMALSDGLIGMNAYMYGENIHHAKEIGQKSMGIRVSGCAGIELIALIKGSRVGYISNLSPWDYAAGIVLLNELGFKYAHITGEPLSFSGREYFLAATPKTFSEINENFF